jgi:transcription initiation factor IIF auxiliary subunit
MQCFASKAPSSPYARVLVYGNRHKRRGKEDREWTAFVEQKGKWTKGQGVAQVAFHLHPTFDPAVALATRAPFQITRQYAPFSPSLASLPN